MNRFFPVIFCMEVSLLSPGHSPLTSEAPPHPGHSVFSHLHNEPLVTREQCLPSAIWEEAPGLGTFSEGPSLGPGPHQHGRPVPIWARHCQEEKGLTAWDTEAFSFSLAWNWSLALGGPCRRSQSGKSFGTELEFKSRLVP